MLDFVELRHSVNSIIGQQVVRVFLPHSVVVFLCDFEVAFPFGNLRSFVKNIILKTVSWIELLDTIECNFGAIEFVLIEE